MSRPTCCVADQFCVAAANFEEGPARIGQCFKCGQDVCSSCSTRRKYDRHGVKRLCNECQIEEDGDDKVVMKRLYKMAGY